MALSSSYLSIRKLLRDEVAAYKRTREALDKDFPLNKKLQLVDALKRDWNTAGELLGIVGQQLSHLPGYFRWRKKTLEIDMQLKKALFLERKMLGGEVELNRVLLEELSRLAKSVPDQEVISVYRDFFQATLEEEKIADQEFAEANAATAEETKNIRYSDDFMRNLSKQKALLMVIDGQARAKVPPSQAVYDGKIAAERLSLLVEEEERFHTVLMRDESIWLAQKKKLINHYAGPWMQEVRRRRAMAKLGKYAAAGIISAGVALYIMSKIEEYLPPKPGRTVTEISREIGSLSERLGKGNLAEVIRTEAGQIQARMNEKIAAENIGDMSKAADAAIALMADRIYDIHIRQLAELLKQHEGLVKLGYDIGYFEKGKEEIKNAIRKTINRQYRPIIVRLVESEVGKHATTGQRIWNWMGTGGGRSDFGRGAERETMNVIIQKLEPMIAELLDEATKRAIALIKSAAEEAAKRTGESVAPDSVRDYVRPTIDLLIVNWYWLGIGAVGFAAFGAMVFSRREKKALRAMYVGGFTDATKHLRKGRRSR